MVVRKLLCLLSSRVFFLPGLVALFLTACNPTPALQTTVGDLTAQQIVTLQSLKKVDDYPLYTMHYQGGYDEPEAAFNRRGSDVVTVPGVNNLGWGCSLFVALGDTSALLYGRNFDWKFSPALLLSITPADGYASISMVDMAYLDLPEGKMDDLVSLPLAERAALLEAPFLPADGMNERGLVVGMAAVPVDGQQTDPAKTTVDSVMIIRLVLDHAATVDDAIGIFQKYNLEWGSGPPLHYLVADSTGKAALVEFSQGKMVVIYNRSQWHLATNFLVEPVKESPLGNCPRYDRINQRLNESGGKMQAPNGLELLSDVSNAGESATQWSIVYQMNNGEVNVVMGRKYDEVHSFILTP